MVDLSKLINNLKHLKHVVYYKFTHRYLYLRHFEWLRDWYQHKFPFTLEGSKIENSFLKNSVNPAGLDTDVPKKVYLIWSGTNGMSKVRQDAVDSICKTLSGFDVILVTPNNIDEFIDSNRPLHPMYDYLSNVHKSDYLRVYLLWAHGGGYTDIKKPKNNWESVYSDFVSSGLWVAGYPEIVFAMIAEPEPFGKDLKKMSSKMIGQGAFISRPKNPFFEELLDEMDRRLDKYSEELMQAPGDVYGTNPGYPIGWTGLLAEILHPLCAKYPEKIFRDKRLLFEYKGIGHR